MQKTKQKQLPPSKRKNIKLFVTKEELNSETLDDQTNSDKYDSSEDIIEHPKAMINKLKTHDEKIETVNNMMSNIFNIDDIDVFVTRDKNGDYWYRAKDIATVLDYVNTTKAIRMHVSEDYKKTYTAMTAQIGPSIKMDPKTIFIDDSGLIQLVSRSKKTEAMKLWRQITKEILPTLFKTGTYTLPPTGIQIEELNKSFYTDNYLSDYANKNAIYLAYIGKHKGKHILKYGKTKDFATRDLEQHRKTFNKFNVLKVWETLACDHVEDTIKTDIEACGLAVTMTKEELKIKCSTKTKRELIQINEVTNHTKIIELIDHAINKTILPKEQKYINQIKDLKNEIKVLESDTTNKDKLIETLKNNLKDKQKLITLLEQNT